MAVFSLYPTVNKYCQATSRSGISWSNLIAGARETMSWQNGVETGAMYDTGLPGYRLWQAFVTFDTTVVNDYAIVDTAELSLAADVKDSPSPSDLGVYAAFYGYNVNLTSARQWLYGDTFTEVAYLLRSGLTLDTRVQLTGSAGRTAYPSSTMTTSYVFVDGYNRQTTGPGSTTSHIVYHGYLMSEPFRPLLYLTTTTGITMEVSTKLGTVPALLWQPDLQRTPPCGLLPTLRMKVVHITAAPGQEMAVYNRDMVMQSVFPAAADWVRRLDGAGSLSFTVPRYYTRRDGVQVDRTDVVQSGAYVGYAGAFYQVQTVQTDQSSNLQVTALSREVELRNYLSNYSVTTGFNRLSTTPSDLMNELLTLGDYDTGWTYVGTLSGRDPVVPFTSSSFVMTGSWARTATAIQSSWAGDILAYAFTGSLVTVVFADGGAGARVKVKVDNIEYANSLDVSVGTSFVISDLSTLTEHLLEIIVVAGTVAVEGLELDPVNRISVRWNYKTVTECLDELLKMLGGEVYCDTISQTIYHDAAQGADASAANLMEFVRGYNILTFEVSEQRTDVVNRLHYLGYGDGSSQLAVVVDDTQLVDGRTSAETYGVRHGVYVNKEVRDLATAQAEAALIVAEWAWPKVAFQATVPDSDAAVLEPGDTVRFAYDEQANMQRISQGGSGITCVGLPYGYILQANRKTSSRGTADSTGSAALVTTGLSLPLTTLEVLNPDYQVVVQLTSADYVNMTTGDQYEFWIGYVEASLRVREIARSSSGEPASLTVGDRVGSIETLIGDPLRNVSKLLK